MHCIELKWPHVHALCHRDAPSISSIWGSYLELGLGLSHRGLAGNRYQNLDIKPAARKTFFGLEILKVS